MKGIQLGNLKKYIMKVLMYSSYEFDRPIIENALHGKLEFVYTDQPLNENTVQLAEGLKPFHSLFRQSYRFNTR
jgi:D-lactate dehydrogenase